MNNSPLTYSVNFNCFINLSVYIDPKSIKGGYSMKLIPESFSMDYFCGDLIYTEAALQASSLTSHLTEGVVNLIGRHESLQAKHKQTIREQAKISASLNAADFNLDTALKQFGLDLLSAVKGDRNNICYKKYFKMSPSMTSRLPMNDEIKEVERIINELSTEQNENIKAHKTALENTKEELKKWIENSKTWSIATSSNMSEIIQWKNDVNRMRVGVYGELLTIASENHLPKSWANTFFKQSATHSQRNEEQATDDTTGISNN